MRYKSSNNQLLYLAAIIILITAQSQAATLAHWRFEAGPADTNVQHGAASGVYNPDIEDVSGNGNHLSVWSTGGNAGYGYRADVAGAIIPLTGQANTLSVRNTGGLPAMWCSADALQTVSPAMFTIEATFKLENSGTAHRTFLGRDSRGTATSNSSLAAVYFQLMPNNTLAFKYCDISGYWHEAVSTSSIVTGFDYGTNPTAQGVPWYSASAVSNGSTLSLYLKEHGVDMSYRLVAQADLTAGGSPNTAMTAGAGDGGDWDAGDWTVGRGLYNGNHGDRAYGFIDEVRISDTALTPAEFLYYELFPAGLIVTSPDTVINEDGSDFADIFFSLEYAPSASVTLNVQEQFGRGQIALDRTTLTFTSGNWAVPQAVRVTAIDDQVLENAEQELALLIDVSSSDANYNALNPDAFTVTVLDDECGAWGYAAADFTVDCIVDLEDLAIFAQSWLECSDPDLPECGDYTE